MSRSWGRSGRDGQVEPTATLVALFAVCVGLGLYAGVLEDVRPGGVDRAVASTALDVVHERTSSGGIVDPRTIDRGTAAAATPSGYRLNVTLRVGERRWTVGPTPPSGVVQGVGPDDRQVADADGDADAHSGVDADTATRPVSVRLDPGSVQPGRLAVVIWR